MDSAQSEFMEEYYANLHEQHIRFEQRIREIMEVNNCTYSEARTIVKKQDQSRAEERILG